MTIRTTIGKQLVIIATGLLLTSSAWANGPGDGTGNDGVGPQDGTGYGDGTGDCTNVTAPMYNADMLLARGGNGNGGDHGNGADNGENGTGDGTDNTGDGPKDGTGYGPGTGDCLNS